MKSLFIWLLILFFHGKSIVGTGGVSVMDGDSVTLHTGVTTDQQEEIAWYFNDTRIAKITGDLKKICTDVQCNEGTERFRDRLKLDNQTGSLNITNTRTTDSGLYKLVVFSSSSKSPEICRVAVQGVPAAQRDKMKGKSVKEGESVTLDPGETKNPNDVLMWYFNDTLITEITGNQSKICTDEQCTHQYSELRNRLQPDHQTGSLTITNTKTTDSGLYTLRITSSRINHRRRRSISITISSVKSFSVSVTAVPDSGLSPAAVGGIGVVLLLVAAAAVVAAVARKKENGVQDPNQKDRLNQESN